ncbi:MAG: hypothetical protein JNM78_08610 [Cyclobacteriaceae bacterium]|nr:hypothetical protein [Cyclobacteriaceae bacterium]
MLTRGVRLIALRLNIFCSSIIVVAVFWASHSLAQLNTNNLTRYTEQDGLPGTEVNKILIDQFGYVWVGTINGLARYDGYSFKRFYSNPNDPGSIKGLVIWSLYEDKKGQIWVGSQPGILNVYNPVTQSFKQYDFSHLVEKGANVEIGISSISEDQRGRLYFGVSTTHGQHISSALLYLDENDDTIKLVKHENDLAVNNIIKSIRDNQGNPWFFSWSGLLRISSEGQLRQFELAEDSLLKDEYPADFVFDSKGHLWIITDRLRLFDIDTETKEYKIISPSFGSDLSWARGTTIKFDSLDNLWIGTSYGLYYYNIEQNKLTGFNNDANKEIQSAIISNLVFDSFGSLWIGTGTYGLFKYEESSFFKSYTHLKGDPNSIAGGWVNNIFETKEGKILITTSGNNESGISMVDVESQKVHSTSYSKLTQNVHTIFGMMEYAPGEFIMNALEKTYLYNTASNTLKEFQIHGLPDSLWILSLLKDSHDNIWVGTYNGLYRRSKGSEKFKWYNINVVAGSNGRVDQINKLVESKKNGLWLLSNSGLFLYDYATDQIERKGFNKNAGDIFITHDINSFYEDPDGIAWVGTWQGGLSRYDVKKGKIKTYTINDGLPSMSIQSILADEENQSLWLSTFEGLSRFNIREEKFYNYSIAEGIQSQLFADGSFLKTSKGDFIFGGSNGITIFHPNDLNKRSVPPRVSLTDLKLFNKSVVPGENSILKKPVYETTEIILEHDQNSITLEFIALHYSNPSKNRYSYKLENYDEDWRENLNYQVAYYPNLPPGEYMFHVKAANNNGVWNEEGANLKIIVKEPWWNTAGAYALYLFLIAGVIFGADRYFRHRVVIKERERARTRELEQAKEIEKAYTELKATQSQLIQSEKMASLGELTAGIAHEIQNPLNFVNNFSEVNSELIEELKAESLKPKADRNEKLEEELLNDIAENEKKIVHHGKRADAIVKGMLQHSRSSSGVKEPTDINALADEYLRLAYHGLRAKDKSFNATMKADFDNTIGNINIVSQDIGRVILNLITNAFYAVNEKAKKSIENYEPTVTVSTHRSLSSGEGRGEVLIKVKDNGNGIPDSIKEKIFQPFFTTKPTGQGTGLGLSLSYDIVKAHGGELKVETKYIEGWPAEASAQAGSEFIILLPIG